MSFFTKTVRYTPDYRDLILYNGVNEFIATGQIINSKIEFYDKTDPRVKILLNPSMSATEYLTQHSNYELFRSREHLDFREFPFKMHEGEYYPTGRIFRRDDLENDLWELMKLNDPDDVQYMSLPAPGSDFIFGKDALTNINNKSA